MHFSLFSPNKMQQVIEMKAVVPQTILKAFFWELLPPFPCPWLQPLNPNSLAAPVVGAIQLILDLCDDPDQDKILFLSLQSLVLRWAHSQPGAPVQSCSRMREGTALRSWSCTWQGLHPHPPVPRDTFLNLQNHSHYIPQESSSKHT